MNDTNIQSPPASRRKGNLMVTKRNKMRTAVVTIAAAGIVGGTMVAHAATLATVAGNVSQDLAQVAAPTWPAVPMTCPTTSTTCTIDLDAGTGSVTVNDVDNKDSLGDATQTVPIYGFRVGVTGDHTLAGGATSTIKVQAGTVLTINFTQSGVGDPIALSFPSLPVTAVSPRGPSGQYIVHADKIGTSVFQPGSNAGAPRQVAMGLVGVLIVTPAATPVYQDEAIVATTDLDPEFAADPTNFALGMGYFGQVRDPNDLPRRVYHVINGKSFPDTDVIDARAGDKLLLRYVNAGVTDKTMGLLGLRQSLLARNASNYTDPQTFVAPLVGPGETADVLVSIPTDALQGQRYSLMDQSRQMNHGTDSGFGGALTFLNVWTGSPTAPTASAVLYDGANVTATGTSSAPAFNITGFETAVTATATPPAEIDWSTSTTVTAAPTVSISKPVSANSGQYVWVRVQQDDSAAQWSAGAFYLVVPAAPPTVDPPTYDTVTNTLTAAAHSSAVNLNVTGYQTAVTDLNTDTPVWSSTTSVAGAPNLTITASVVANAGQYVWIRVQQNDVDLQFSIGVKVQAPPPAPVVAVAPIVDSATSYVASTSQLTIAAHSTVANIAAVEYSIAQNGDPIPAAGSGTAITGGSFGSSTFSQVATVAQASIGQTVWVRAQDSHGIWSDALGVVVS